MIRCTALSLCCLLIAAGCQSYSPKPLDTDAHWRAWAERSISADELRRFQEQLAQPAPEAAYDPDDGLSVDEARLIALVFNPSLREARAQADIAQAIAANAGLWDDPVLSVDVLRVVQSIPDPWVIGGMVGFTIPLSGRLEVEKSLAGAEHAIELRRVAEQEWAIEAELYASWIDWSAARLHADLIRQLIERVDAIVVIADRLQAAGVISRLEARLFSMELAGRRSELPLREARADELELELKSLLGLVPDASVKFLPETSTGFQADPDDPPQQIALQNPKLARLRAEYEVAEHALNLEIRRQYPDLEIGPAYEWDEGQSKIGFGLGMPLPILNANRQAIAEATAAREAARIQHEAEYERLVSQYARAERQLQAANAARREIESNLTPLVEAQLADERRLTEAGELNPLVTLESLVRALETKTQLIDAQVMEAQAAIRLRELLGPTLVAEPMETHP